MMARMPSEVKYALSGDVHIAYRIFGDGPRDLVLVPGTLSHVELYWEFPINRYLLKRLTSFARVIVFDKRGQGLSDRVAEQTSCARRSEQPRSAIGAGASCSTGTSSPRAGSWSGFAARRSTSPGTGCSRSSTT